MKKSVTCILPLLWLTLAVAQEEPTDDASEVADIRRYTVEVIIFRNVEDFGLGSEQFYPDDPPVADDVETAIDELGLVDSVEVAPATRGMDLLTYAANADALRFALLDENELTMTDVRDRFELLDAYETMMHFGWTQPTLPPEQTQPVQLRIFGETPDGLDGSFTLYLSRYLHLVVDLALAAPGEDGSETGIGEPVPSFGDPVAQYIEPLAAPNQPVFYRIQEDRIVKSGDTRYFDHPKFGMVAKVTRVEEEVQRPDADADLLGGPGQ